MFALPLDSQKRTPIRSASWKLLWWSWSSLVLEFVFPLVPFISMCTVCLSARCLFSVIVSFMDFTLLYCYGKRSQIERTERMTKRGLMFVDLISVLIQCLIDETETVNSSTIQAFIVIAITYLMVSAIFQIPFVISMQYLRVMGISFPSIPYLGLVFPFLLIFVGSSFLWLIMISISLVHRFL